VLLKRGCEEDLDGSAVKTQDQQVRGEDKGDERTIFFTTGFISE
jgi:hypothetical protein